MAEFPRDFPAAHSMDTTWFAVDADGFVAMLISSEPGTAPSDISDPHAIDGERFVERLLPGVKETSREAATERTVYELAGFEAAQRGHRHYDELLVFLSSTDAVEGDVARGEAVLLRGKPIPA